VARAIERCLTRPGVRVASVPRVVGAARLAGVAGVRQAFDLAASRAR
jgi:hypothetical protein